MRSCNEVVEEHKHRDMLARTTVSMKQLSHQISQYLFYLILVELLAYLRPIEYGSVELGCLFYYCICHAPLVLNSNAVIPRQ